MILAGVAAEYTPSLDTAVDARHSGNRIQVPFRIHGLFQVRENGGVGPESPFPDSARSFESGRAPVSRFRVGRIGKQGTPV